MTAFTVKVGEAEYDVDAPDEKTAWKWANATHFKTIKAEGNVQKPPTPYKPSGETALTPQEEVLGNPMVRGLVGAAAPFVGAGQLAANVVGLGEPVNKAIAETEKNIERGRNYIGSTGFDAFRAGGQMASPAYLGATGAMPNAASTLGRIGQGAAFGAGAGLVEPVSREGNYWGQKAGQVGMGATVGAVIPGAWEGAKAVGRGVRNIVQPSMGEWGANQSAGRMANIAAGDKADEIINQLRQPTSFVPGSSPTAAQAAAPAGSAEFSALEKIYKNRAPSKYDAIEQSQNQARIQALRSIGKTPEELQAAELVRAQNAAEMYSPELMGTKVSPQSQTQVMEDAIKARYQSRAAALQDQGRFATTAAQMEERGNKFVPVPGMPRVSARASNFPDRVKEATRAVSDTEPVIRTRMSEEKFLTDMQEQLKNTVCLDNRSLYDFLSRPSVKRAIHEAAESAAEKGIYFPSKPGDNFSVANLQRIKQAISDEINKNQAVQGLGATQKKEITDTVGAFTKWLENKVPDWGKARLQYMEDSLPINQMEVGQFLEKKLVPALSDEAKQRSASYANALRESEQLVKRSTGQARPLTSFMRPDQMETLRNVQSDLARDATVQRLTTAGMPQAERSVASAVPEIPSPGVFNLVVGATRSAINRLGGRADEAMIRQLAKHGDNPQKLAELMYKAKPFERQALVDALMRYQSAMPQAIDQGR